MKTMHDFSQIIIHSCATFVEQKKLAAIVILVNKLYIKVI